MARVSPRLISLSVAGINRAAEVSRAVITSTETDVRILGSPVAERDYDLNLRIAQDHASGTLWDLIWTTSGSSVNGVYAPHGNTTPTPTLPHFAFTALVVEPDGDILGSEAIASTSAVAAVEVTWPLAGKPTKVTA